MAKKKRTKHVAGTKPKQQPRKRLGSPSQLLAWERRFKELKAFKQEYGHCDVPVRYQPNPALGRWVRNVRHVKRTGTLAEEKVRHLDALGFCWAPRKTWEQRIHDLNAFKKLHGHCNVPATYQPNLVLANWVNNVRQAKRAGTLAGERVRRLDALGFCWAPRKTWEQQRIHDLKAFKTQHGHCNVPYKYQPNSALGYWVSGVRCRKKRGELDKKIVRCLNSLGFSWVAPDTSSRSWKQRIHDLKAFKKIHGHCNVPLRYPLNPVLGRWATWIRHSKKRGVLAEDRVRCLDALGFSWVRKVHGIQVPWEQRVNDLKAFKEQHGDCNVPYGYHLNPALGSWVANVRQRKKRGKLTVEQFRSLDALGFRWKRRETSMLPKK